MKITIDEKQVTYKYFLKKVDINIADITNAYMRVEEVNANVCCGRANFNRHFLIVACNGNLDSPYKLELESAEDVKNALDKVKLYNSEVVIGYKQ